jgi:hypothetical protein
MDSSKTKPRDRKQASPEELLGSTRYKDLPDIIPQELRDRSIPADDLNPHFAGANMRLWRRDDYRELFQLIEQTNSVKRSGSYITFANLCELEIAEGIARVISEFIEFADEPEHFDYDDLYKHLEEVEEIQESDRLYFAELGAFEIKQTRGDWKLPAIGFTLIFLAVGWLLYGVFLLLRWLWQSVASWIG